jgi:hypothetical protein
MSISEEQLEQPASLGADVLDEKDLSEALDSVRERVRVIEARLSQLEQLAIKARKEEHLLEGLLALRRGGTADESISLLARASSSSQDGASAHETDVAEASIGILEAAGRPMHISELKTVLERRGVRIPGKGTQANLIARLRRDERIARAARGMYGLTALGVQEYQPKKRRRSRARKKTRARRDT